MVNTSSGVKPALPALGVAVLMRAPKNPIIKWIRRVFPFSDQGLGTENDILDTFDGYSPRFHGIHSPEEVQEWFRAAGLVNIRRLPWNTAVRGRRAA